MFGPALAIDRSPTYAREFERFLDGCAVMICWGIDQKLMGAKSYVPGLVCLLVKFSSANLAP